MSWVAVAVAGTGLVGSVISNEQQREAGERASGAQIESAERGVAEQRRQFDQIMELLSPYVEGGRTAFQAQQELVGLGEPGAQEQAIRSIQESPEFEALRKQGETALLQSASATGGVRGGNIQGALAEFRPNLLASLIDRRFQNLGTLSQLGQASAAGVGSAGQQTGANVANLLAQQGAARAGGILSGAGATAGNIGAFGEFAGTVLGAGGGTGTLPIPTQGPSSGISPELYPTGPTNPYSQPLYGGF